MPQNCYPLSTADGSESRRLMPVQLSPDDS